MNREELIKWSQDRNVIVGLDPHESEEKPFAIVQDWGTIEHDNWESFCKALEITEYGFSDEYTTCSECSRIIRTSPTHWGWSPDYWINYDAGEITCCECLPDYEEEYLEWLAEQNGPQSCILSEERLTEHGFTCLLQGLTNGIHEGDTDNPTAIYEYLRASYEVAFILSPSQFTTGFDVWIRKQFSYLETEETIDKLKVSEETIRELRTSMIKDTYESPYGNSDTLLTEFANLYTAKNMQAGLKAISGLPAQEKDTMRLVKVRQDGIECLDISQDDFVAGDKAREFLT